MRKRFILAAFLIMPSVSFAEPVSVSSAPFESVDFWSSRQSSIVFYSVRIKDSVWKVAISVDLVEVVLAEDTKDYTTLNLVNAEESFGSVDWLKAEKAVVIVRSNSDLELWQKFLMRVKKQQELEREKWKEPIRVLPPIEK